MCYFQYLEERGYLEKDKQFLYGQLLQSVSCGVEEPVLLYLEMLRVLFPGGASLGAPLSEH
jgi:hypothetical protein